MSKATLGHSWPKIWILFLSIFLSTDAGAQLITNGNFNDPTGTSVGNCANGIGDEGAAPSPWQLQFTPDYSTVSHIQFDGSVRTRISLAGFDESPDGGCIQGFRSSTNQDRNEGVYQTTSAISNADLPHAFGYQYTEYTLPPSARCTPQVELRINSTDDSNGMLLVAIPGVGDPDGPANEGAWITRTGSFIPADFGISDGQTISLYFGTAANGCEDTWGFVDAIFLAPIPSLTKALDPSLIVTGGVAIYTWTLDNTQTGSAAATGMSFTDMLPSSIQIAATPNIVNSCGGTVVAPAGGTSVSASDLALAAGSSCTLSIDVTNALGALNNSCVTNPPAFTNSSDNLTVAGMSNQVTPQCLLVLSALPADLSVLKTLDTASPYDAGDTIQYTLLVSNNGPNTATNVLVEDTPSNLTLTNVSSTHCAALPCTIPSLASGSSETITVMATINASGAFDNVVTVSATEPDLNLMNNTDSDGNGGTAGSAADVSMMKTLDTAAPFTVGDTIQYTLVVANVGPSTATNVQVTDTPTNLTITSVSSTHCAALPCTIPSLANGSSETLTVMATIDAGGLFDNVATASADETDPDPSDNTDDTDNDDTAGSSADMSIVKTLDSAGPFTVGDTVQYTLIVANAGPSTATNVQVTDTPTNLTITSVSSTGCAALPCTIASLTSGSSETITVMATIDAGGAFDNLATVSADETDPDLSNNTDDAGNGGSTGAMADVSIIKTLETPPDYLPGASVEFTLEISNAGPDTATNVVVTDTPTNLMIMDVIGTECMALPCTLPSLASGASQSVTVVAIILEPGNFSNTAEVTADPFDPDLSNNADFAEATASLPPADIPVDAPWALLLLVIGISLVAIPKLSNR